MTMQLLVRGKDRAPESERAYERIDPVTGTGGVHCCRCHTR